MATWRNVVLLFGPHSLTQAELPPLDALLQRLIAEHEQGTAVLRWVPPGAAGPDSKVRDRVIEIFAGLGQGLRGYATVLESGSAFWNSGAQSVLFDINRRSEFAAPIEVFSELDEATVWVAERFDPPLPLAPLRLAVARAKTQIAELGAD